MLNFRKRMSKKLKWVSKLSSYDRILNESEAQDLKVVKWSENNNLLGEYQDYCNE